MEDVVNQKLCDERNGNLVKRVDKHGEEIDDIKSAVIKLTQIVENMEKKSSQVDITPKISFWQTPSGAFIIRTLCVIGVAITFAAIGMNYFKEYLQTVVGR